MCELLGAALNAAVAQALHLPHRVEQWAMNPKKTAAVWLVVDGEVNFDNPYAPSTDNNVAMTLQFLHDIAVYPDPDADGVGVEKWVAGFNWSIEQDPNEYTFSAPISYMDHAARGTTPAVAICRAIVQRSLDQVAVAIENEARMQRERAAEAETERLEVVRGKAWDRANIARCTRVPFTEFEDDEAQQAYARAMDDQLDLVRRQNNGDKT